MNNSLAIKIALVLPVAISVGLLGCAQQTTSKYTAAQQQQAEAIQFTRPYELSRQDVEYIDLGPIKGSSCQKTRFSAKATQEQAIMELKLAAVATGANTLVLQSCRFDDNGSAAQSSCHSEWLCSGQAFQKQPLQ